MSRRTVTRFALPGLLAAALAGPSPAADVAPMPRTAAKTFKVEFEFRLYSEEVIEAAPMPHAARPVSVRPPCCAFDCCQELAVAPMPRSIGPSEAARRENVERMKKYYGDGSYHIYIGRTDEKGTRTIDAYSSVFDALDQVWVSPMPRDVGAPLCDTENHHRLLQLSADVFGTEDRIAVQPPIAPVGAKLLPPPQPVKPANVPPEAFDTLSRTFGEMLNAPPPPTACPTLVPCPVRPIAASVPAQPVAAPCPLPTACAKTATSGTWTRELAGMMYVVKVAPDHITITASSSVELPDGSTHTEGVVITADYHLARDGTTIVGLITSVDAVIEGDLPPAVGDVPPPGDDLAELQKSLVDKPFAFSVRHYGDVMAIGNVRLPEVEGARTVAQALTVLGGRYTSIGDRPVPKPRAAKPPVLRDILPVPLTANPPPVYISPQTGIVQASGTSLQQPLPPLPRDVSDRLPGIAPPSVTIPPAPPLMPANLNSTPLVPHAEPARPETAPMPRTVPKAGKKGKKKVTNE